MAEGLIKEMTDIMSGSRTYYKISGERVPLSRLQDIVKEADINWFIVVVARLLKWGQDVKNGRAYARSVILNMDRESLDRLSDNAQDYDFCVNENHEKITM